MATINGRQPILLIGLLVIVSRVPATTPLSTAHEVEENCFSVPSSVFTSAVRSTINEIQTAISFITKFAGKKIGDFRLRNAVTDCADLLDFSTDELTWALSTTQNASNSNLLGNTFNLLAIFEINTSYRCILYIVKYSVVCLIRIL